MRLHQSQDPQSLYATQGGSQPVGVAIAPQAAIVQVRVVARVALSYAVRPAVSRPGLTDTAPLALRRIHNMALDYIPRVSRPTIG